MMDQKFNLPLRLEKQHANSIMRYLREALTAASNSGDIITFMEALSGDATFQRLAQKLANRFITNIMTLNSRSWKNISRNTKYAREMDLLLKREMSGPMGDAVRALVDYNAFLISSTPVNISKLLTNKALEMQQEGLRANEIATELFRLAPGLTSSRINLIARTEASKASTALTRARSFDLGLDWYTWQTSRDGRVRKSHVMMNDVLIRWTDPPSPEVLAGERSYGKYNAGEIFNCRCVPIPVIDFGYITWPHKVYVNGSIQMMSRGAFEGRVA